MRIAHAIWFVLGGLVGAVLALALTMPTVSWTDGDSGEIGHTRFRLMDVDAPERRGAKCEAEDQLADEAKAFMERRTRWGFVWISETDGRDSSGRLLVRLSVNGSDLIRTGTMAGYLKPWPHNGSKALADRPGWCPPTDL